MKKGIDMKTHYRYFKNRKCEYFPCHKNAEKRTFNCLFCYCPLYPLGDKCGGAFLFTKKGVKDCSACALPHSPGGYEYIRSRIDEVIEISKQKTDQ
jgi:Zn-finger protein